MLNLAISARPCAKEFLEDAKDAYGVVMSHFADNKLQALEPMLSSSVFNAFRDTWQDGAG